MAKIATDLEGGLRPHQGCLKHITRPDETGVVFCALSGTAGGVTTLCEDPEPIRPQQLAL